MLWYPLPDDNLSAQPNIKRQAINQRSVADWHYLLSQLIEKELGGKPNSGQTKFFAMGLTSLRLIKIHVALIQAGASTLKLNDLFEHASIDELSSFLAGESMSPPSIVSTVTEQATLNETSADQEAIAVIGMAINVSQCADLATFWRAVMDSRELVERDRSSIITNSEDKERKVTVRSSLSGIFDFDPNWFGISPQEAKRMDPQQRHLLMSVVQALENAGYSSREDLTSVGIVASTGDAFYQRWLERRNCEENHNSDPFSLGLSYQKDFVATKVAYYLGLRGPALTVQTGCSSSLVAVHQACNALNMGDAEMMVVAGVNIDPDAVQGYKWAPGHIFSKQGSTNPFSDTADGTLATNACGVVILKPLAAARRDNDRIYAVISGSAINNDGRDKAGYTAPSVAGQTKVINLALARAGIAADRIGYVEAHGTATPLGDPIEIAALSRAFLSTTSKTGFCHIASVKSQLGHAGPAAGILGLIRAALALYHQVLPANVGYERANPLLEIDKTPFTTSATSRQWNSEELRYAGVSSFGMGGTNVHLILREPQQQERCTHSVKQTGICLAPLSASTPQALQRLIVQLLNVMRTSSLDLSTLCARLSLHKPQSIRYLGIWNELGKAQAEMESWLTQGQNSQQILRRIDRLQNSQQLSSTQAQQCRDWLLDEESSWPISRVDNHPASWQFSITNFACAPFMLLPTGVPAKLPTKQWRYTPCWQVAVQPKMAVADLCLVIGRLPDNVQLTARQVRVLSVEEKSDQLLQQAANTAGNVQILWVSSVGESAVELLLSLTYVVQAASKWLPNRTLELDLLTVSALSTAVGEAVLPEQAMLTSALNVIMQEHPQIHCAFLDCSADSPTVAIGYGLSQHGMVHAWRRKGWLKLSYQPLAEQPLHQLSTLLPSGTYLVLGGSGGIGQALVQAIAAIAPHSQFVLVSRCVNKEPVVLHLAGQCEYESLSCDITNIAEVQSLTHLLQERYSHIQGILHCAGVPAGALIARHQCAEDFVVVEEKIRSCDALEILQALEPRWIICASSMSAIHGGVGQLSYACANGYLDAWVAAKAANQQNCCYRTINWDIWQDGGMSVQELPAGLRRHDNLLHLSTGITRREGAEMLYQTMSTPQTQQLVCTTGFTESRWFYQQHIPSRPSMAASSDLADKFSLPLIRKLYAEHLGIEESDNNTSWESMGGDSIQALD
ncbi:beta-ketoacyl synthase N-terminal-like domain-containing protein [Candidatus Arsenophonus nilaparvatae]|uniref:beta-ketoacyl synthase N-terminal-like domain-containing protein n=1 Tax=Candidatus Arsenophonus nilaparvatae TaxID=1247023 RepID=UPI00387835C7